MADQKTKPTTTSIEEYFATLDDSRRQDCEAIRALMQQVTGEEAVLWGTSIVGFGKVHYKYASGTEGDTMLAGFSSRKANITFYLTGEWEQDAGLLASLGKHTLGKGCLYIKKLADVDTSVLRQLITNSVATIKELYPNQTTPQE